MGLTNKIALQKHIVTFGRGGDTHIFSWGGTAQSLISQFFITSLSHNTLSQTRMKLFIKSVYSKEYGHPICPLQVGVACGSTVWWCFQTNFHSLISSLNLLESHLISGEKKNIFKLATQPHKGLPPGGGTHIYNILKLNPKISKQHGLHKYNGIPVL